MADPSTNTITPDRKPLFLRKFEELAEIVKDDLASQELDKKNLTREVRLEHTLSCTLDGGIIDITATCTLYGHRTYSDSEKR